MTIRNRIVGLVASICITIVIAMLLVVLWGPLTLMIQELSGIPTMFFETGFWTFAFLIGGLIMITGVVIRFALLAKWGSRN